MKNTDKEFIIDNTLFGKVESIGWTDASIKEFIIDEIFPHPNCSVLLPKLSNLYVLVAIMTNEYSKWENIMNEKQYGLFRNNLRYVLGYMYITNTNDEPIHYIEFIDTRLRGYNLARYMIDQYEKYYVDNSDEKLLGGIVIPREIVRGSVGYWKNYFSLWFYVCTYDELSEFINEFNIDRKMIKWDEMMGILVNGNSDDPSEIAAI